MTAPFVFRRPQLADPADAPQEFVLLIGSLHDLCDQAERNVELLADFEPADDAARRARFRELTVPALKDLRGAMQRLPERSIPRHAREYQRWRDLSARDIRRVVLALEGV
ncbi:MAG TPA: hypothetical protein VI172_12940 [Candidatus Dormibacteraeota bacterium]